jgi:metal-dependent amidase/aminoacylase/carboxypeptidase family protein
MLDKPKVQSRMYSPEKYATSGTIYRTMKQTQNTAPKTKKMNNIVRQRNAKQRKHTYTKVKTVVNPVLSEGKAVPEYYKAPVVLLIVNVACDRGNIQIVFDLFFE